MDAYRAPAVHRSAVDLYLHGFAEADPDVRLVWRADLVGADGSSATDDEMQAAIERLPPQAAEMLEVPLRAVRPWLRGLTRQEPVSDGPSLFRPSAPKPGEESDDERWKALKIPTSGDSEIVVFPRDVRRVRPGDTIVMSSTVGGCDRWGWNPLGREPVTDLAELVASESSDVFALRLLAPALRSIHQASGLGALPAPEESEESAVDAAAAWQRLGMTSMSDEDALGLADALMPLQAALGWEAFAVSGLPLRVSKPVKHVVVRMRRRAGSRGPDGADEGAVTADPFTSSCSTGPVPLEQHLQAVAARARDIVDRLDLPADVADVVVQAAAWHDVGKLDPRFQRSLRGGSDDPFAAFGEPLAKSGMDLADRASFGRAHRLSGVPAGFRHEAGSAQAAMQRAADLRVADVDLFVHLVAAHHGHARPLFPPVPDDGEVVECEWAGGRIKLDPGTSFDWRQPSRFQLLNERYGRWGLALLEAVVRLADIECSKEGT